MHKTRQDIDSMDKVYRLNLINSLSGVKPANLIGTRSTEGYENLAIISSVVHIGSNPPLLGFFVRPHQQVKRHTFVNLQESGEYSINHLPHQFSEQGHWTSAKFTAEESEFEYCGFSPEYIQGFSAPFVKSARVKIGLQFRQAIPIEINDTTLVIGEICHVVVDDDLVDAQGCINLERSDSAGISGVSSYYRLEKVADHPYARRDRLPESIKA